MEWALSLKYMVERYPSLKDLYYTARLVAMVLRVRIFSRPSMLTHQPIASPNSQSVTLPSVITAHLQQEPYLVGKHVEDQEIPNIVWFALDCGSNWIYAHDWMCLWATAQEAGVGQEQSGEWWPWSLRPLLFCHRQPLAHAPHLVAGCPQDNPTSRYYYSISFWELKPQSSDDTQK